MDDVKIGEILLPGEESDQEKRARRVKAGFWPTFRRAVRHLPFARDVVAAFYCATDTRTPVAARATLLAALAYFIAPIDLIPDFLALVGFSDDAAVLMSVIAILRGHLTDEHYRKARAALEEPPVG